MRDRRVRGIFAFAALCIALTVASVLAPRAFRGSGDGFAPAATAAIVFLALATLAGFGSLALLFYTLRRYRTLPVPARIAGAAPSALLVVGLVCLVLLFRS